MSAQAARKPQQPKPQKTKEEVAAERKREVHVLTSDLRRSRERAKGQFGRSGHAVLDLSCPPDVQCRVGVRELVPVFRQNVETLHVKGAGRTWEQAFDEARRQK